MLLLIVMEKKGIFDKPENVEKPIVAVGETEAAQAENSESQESQSMAPSGRSLCQVKG